MSKVNSIKFNGYEKVHLVKWNTRKDARIFDGMLLFTYNQRGIEKKFMADDYGKVLNLLVGENELVSPGQELIEYEECLHTTVMKDLCCECGQDLRKTGGC